MSSEKYPYIERENFDSGEIYKFFKDNLVGHRITKITHESIELDNGYVVKIHPNYGCDCGKGNSFIDFPSAKGALDAAIMNVKYEETEYDEQFSEPGFKIFVLMKNHKICFEGNDASDGEPYYGSGFWVDATMPADREREAEEAKRREEARRARNGGTLWW